MKRKVVKITINYLNINLKYHDNTSIEFDYVP